MTERGKKSDLNLIRRTKAREGRTPLLKVNNLPGRWSMLTTGRTVSDELWQADMIIIK